jgi:hypothetical protein
MSGSQGKIARKWQSLQMSQTMKDEQGSYTPASFAYSYRITSVLNSGKGNQWYGYNVVMGNQVSEKEIFDKAADFHDTLSKQNR